jgi:acyl-CoA thioesterase
VSIENAVTYPAAVHPGDVLTAAAVEEAASNRISYYRVEVRNQREEVVALFRGTAYQTTRAIFPDHG